VDNSVNDINMSIRSLGDLVHNVVGEILTVIAKVPNLVTDGSSTFPGCGKELFKSQIPSLAVLIYIRTNMIALSQIDDGGLERSDFGRNHLVQSGKFGFNRVFLLLVCGIDDSINLSIEVSNGLVCGSLELFAPALEVGFNDRTLFLLGNPAPSLLRRLCGSGSLG